MASCWNGVTREQHDRLAAYRDLILDSNRAFNLTALRDAESIDGRLIAESLRLLPFLPTPLGDLNRRILRAVDIGTGSGVPGIPLAIARPDIDFTLIEATGKKVRFLELVVAKLGLANVTPMHERAETAAHDPAFREQNELAVARAVTQLAALSELTLPFLKTGGRALFPKGKQLGDELDRARIAIELLGGRLVSADLLPPISCCGVTRLVILDKIGSSLVRYPRRPGIPEHDPLGG
jgi:16S rRNA (guanine527-N7)-methyltransferase